MKFTEYDRLDGLDLGRLVRTKQVTARELLELAIARAAEVNPSLNAIVHQDDDRAREGCAQPEEGPFQGVPVLLKDIMGLCAGFPTRLASRSTPADPSARDSEFVARLRRAGFVPFGKTNAPEFGLIPTTESGMYGPARNPWDTSRTTGGSSGGSAAAVAAGIVPVAHANDGGGSIRIPASACGVLGLKLTRGRTSIAPGSDPTGLVSEFVVTRTVRDTAAVLDATAGSVPGDAQWLPPPTESFLAALDARPKGLRIAVLERDPAGRDYAPECAQALRKTADLLSSLGHHPETADPRYDYGSLSHSFRTLWFANAATLADGLAMLRGARAEAHEHDPLTFAMIEAGRGVTAVQYQIARFALDLMTRRLCRFMTGFDAILTPTLSVPPFPLGQVDIRASDANAEIDKCEALVAHAPIANAAGLPAVSVPLHTTDSGLPIGMQFMAPAGEEALLLRLAAQLEEVLPWRDRRP